MGWEERHGHQYYYRSVREGKRVRKEYVGGEALCQLAAQVRNVEFLVKRTDLIASTGHLGALPLAQPVAPLPQSVVAQLSCDTRCTPSRAPRTRGRKGL